MIKISIIVPVYNVENYIQRCAQSLFEQTLSDLEFVFVDDNSPDKSIDILNTIVEKYPDRKNHVKIVKHKQNSGLPTARYSGVKESSGEYILHCDSDDWLLPETCEELYYTAINNNSDVVVFDLMRTDGKYIKAANTADIHRFTLDMMYMRSSWSVVNKLFKRSVYNVVEKYPTRNVGEDMGLCLQLIYGCKVMSYIPKAYYQYFVNPSSMSNGITVIKALNRYVDAKDNVDLVLDFYNTRCKTKAITDGLTYVKWSVRRIIYGTIYRHDCFKIWASTYPGIGIRLLVNPEVRFKEKIKIILTYLHVCPLRKERILS